MEIYSISNCFFYLCLPGVKVWKIKDVKEKKKVPEEISAPEKETITFKK